MSHRLLRSIGILALVLAAAFAGAGTCGRPGHVVRGEDLDCTTYTGRPAGPAGNMDERHLHPLGTTRAPCREGVFLRKRKRLS